MKRLLLILVFSLSIGQVRAQVSPKDGTHAFSKYAGKYEANGMVVQVALSNDTLVLVVPGAPPQEMIFVEADKFKSATFRDSYFLFAGQEGKVDRMISQSPQGAMELMKISDTPDEVNAGDSLLTLRKSTENFVFLYSETDRENVNRIAGQLERSYHKILNDFKLKGYQ